MNKPVLDFQCQNCDEKYELKSKKGKFGARVLNSAYSKKVEAINAQVNPSFLFLQYDRSTWKVTSLFALPRFLFFREMIRPRKPLRESAQRAGWVGSIMLLGKLPPDSRVYVVRDGNVVRKRKLGKHGPLYPDSKKFLPPFEAGHSTSGTISRTFPMSSLCQRPTIPKIC